MDTIVEAQTMNGKKAVSAWQDRIIGKKEDLNSHQNILLGHATVIIQMRQ
jgi:hypothetical protein